jgi:hypothetical protein
MGLATASARKSRRFIGARGFYPTVDMPKDQTIFYQFVRLSCLRNSSPRTPFLGTIRTLLPTKIGAFCSLPLFYPAEPLLLAHPLPGTEID